MATPKTKLFVGHLPENCVDKELEDLFGKYGTVVECDVINRYGFVHMSSPAEADEAIKNLNNFQLRGQTISVERSKSRMHHEPGAPGRATAASINNKRNYDDYGRPPFDRRGDGYGDRMRPYASPYGRPHMDSPRDMYDNYRSPPMRGPYGPRDPYAAPRDPYAAPRDPYAAPRDPYTSPRDPYSSGRDSYATRDPYAMPRNPYAAPRDPYGGSSYAANGDSSGGLYERRSMGYPAQQDYPLYSRRSPAGATGGDAGAYGSAATRGSYY